ncbi:MULTISPECIES: hypothetical protein [Mycobacterium]|nr:MULTISPECIES: hypothetical protein [Mycobacterium]QNI15299.1 hypothetical protein GAN18_29445 [Mycobacterium kubicae]
MDAATDINQFTQQCRKKHRQKLAMLYTGCPPLGILPRNPVADSLLHFLYPTTWENEDPAIASASLASDNTIYEASHAKKNIHHSPLWDHEWQDSQCRRRNHQR